ncbi:MAG: phosphate acyltransferase PlsX [Syntrophomonadaceae bacterium]
MKIAVDVMGSDRGPGEVIAGAWKWAEETGNQVFLVGNADVVEKEMQLIGSKSDLVSCVGASEVITMDESPAYALRKKKDASIVIATGLVKQGLADAVLSCGSTGAQMAAAIFILGRMEGVERSPIVTPLPGAKDLATLLVDVGANVDCRPKQLLQFAVLGKTYATIVTGNPEPRIALLNNGEEEGKGNSVSVETYELLKKQSNLKFIGNIEGRDLLLGKADVVVCDGFVGNVVIKTLEGAAMFIAREVVKEFGRLPAVFEKLDYTKVGGAPLLGVNGISIVCHGSSNRDAVYYGMKAAYECGQKDIIGMQREAIEQTRE